MSEVKVNKISPRSGTDVTLGDSGDTFTIPSGATLVNNGTATGFGATVTWDTTAKTANFTAVSKVGYFVDTTSGVITVTLPATPSAGDIVGLVDYAGTFDTNFLIIDPNGENIEGQSSPPNQLLTGEREGVILIYVDSTQGWLPISGINEGTDALEPNSYSVDFLVIAGGGGGGGHVGGGGGAGGYRESTQTVNTGTLITVTVGDGGAGGPYPATPAGGTNGSNSSISGSNLTTITSAGGGFGGGFAQQGGSGGSGGGSGYAVGSGGSGNTPSTAPSQGNNGGAGAAAVLTGGGGGGASAIGADGVSVNGGNGGNGTASSITGSPATRAGGGGGTGDNTGGTGGSGGGGAGAPGFNPGVAGIINTGGGGGGSRDNIGAAGGKGVVILSMPLAKFSGTTTGSPTESTSGSNKILVFNGDGSYTA
jgi:hypothetical protein